MRNVLSRVSLKRGALLSSFLVTGLLVTSNPTFAIDADTTGDGLDELIVVNKDSDDNLDWEVRSSESSYATAVATSGNLGKDGDNLIPGRWQGSDLNLGFVRLREDNSVRWNIETAASEAQSVNFGSKNDILISGGDYNGDRIYDIATLNKKGQVEIRLGAFGSAPTTTTASISRRAAKRANSDRGAASFIRVGTSDQVVVVFRNKKKGRYRMVRTDGTQVTLQGTGRGALLDAIPIENTDGSYAIALVERRGKSRRRVSIFNQSGTRLYRDVLAGTTVVVGKYTSTSVGEQIGIKNGNSLNVVSVFGDGSSSSINVGSGIYTDLVNVNSFASSSTTGGDLDKVCPKRQNFGGGQLWKPDSDVNDNRGGKPVYLLSGGNKTSRSPRRVFDSKGNVVCKGLTFKAPNINGINGGADHYYAGWVGGCDKTGGQMGNEAKKNTGSKEVYVEWKNNTCLIVPDPDRRYGGL